LRNSSHSFRTILSHGLLLVGGEWRRKRVLFSGFDSVEHHIGFSKTDEFQKYRSIVEYVDGFELKHMKRLEGM
jgi:hypothetical protein